MYPYFSIIIAGCRAFSYRIRRPLLSIDALPVGCIINAPPVVDITARVTVLPEVFFRVVPGNVKATAEPHRKLTVTVGVDVLGVAFLQQVFACPLPAVGGQHPAEGAGVTVGHPCLFCTVPDGIAGGGVRARALDKAAHAACAMGGGVVC